MHKKVNKVFVNSASVRSSLLPRRMIINEHSFSTGGKICKQTKFKMEALTEARTKVNGKFLAEFNGKPVTVLGKVLKVHPNGCTIEVQTTDNMVVNGILTEPLSELVDGWVELRGLGQGKCHVITQHYLQLSNAAMSNFDADLYNDLINIINTCSNPWVNS